MKRPVLLALASVSIIGCLAARAHERGRLVVHEWGTFTSVVGANGVPVAWRPLSGPPDLPGFVYGSRGATPERCLAPPPPNKAAFTALVRMETPVLYFYADRATSVNVGVAFPNGQITEWYPKALAAHAGLAWGRVEVRPGDATPLLVESGPSHYYAARRTDAAPLRVAGEAEKFLFYRGVGQFLPPLSLTLEGQTVVTRPSLVRVSRIVLFENRGGRVGWGLHSLGSNPSRLPRPRLGGSVDSLRDALAAELIASGLYPREAQAMVDTWDDSWFEEGLRAFYVLPRTLTDDVIPLRLDPRPDELVRVLVARAEVITPEMVAELGERVARLDAASAAERAEILEFLHRRGRFAEPILRRLAAGTNDIGLRARIEGLIQQAEARLIA